MKGRPLVLFFPISPHHLALSASTMAANITTFPPDTLCFGWSPLLKYADPSQCTNFTETVTLAMVQYLNLTTGVDTYKQAYCNNPQAVSLLFIPVPCSADVSDPIQDDSCPFGYCPNPDIAGEYA